MIDHDDEHECEEGSPPWMATFSDLATLLLTFFVLLLSFAELDVIEFRELLGSIREAFGVQFVTVGPVEAMTTRPVELNDMPATPLSPITDVEAAKLRDIQRMIEDRGLDGEVEMDLTDAGIRVRVQDRVLFETGSARLSDSAGPVLDNVAELAVVMGPRIVIEGHTDDRPIHTYRYPSNWELSTARAAAVVRYLADAEQIDADRMSAAGYADMRPLDANDTDEGRSRNRRVEFLFERPAPDPESPDSRPTPPRGLSATQRDVAGTARRAIPIADILPPFLSPARPLEEAETDGAPDTPLGP